jgi:hypothetical protein
MLVISTLFKWCSESLGSKSYSEYVKFIFFLFTKCTNKSDNYMQGCCYLDSYSYYEIIYPIEGLCLKINGVFF